MSPEGSALCYRRIARLASEIADADSRPLITLHNLPFATYLDAVYEGDWAKVGQMLRWSSETLAAAGADFCILPDNVAHYAMHFVEDQTPIPWVNMIDLVAEAVCRDGLKTVGIIGTKLLMTGSVYQTVLGMRGVVVHPPSDEDADRIDSVIFNELVEGRIEPESQQYFTDSIKRLQDNGCEGVILGSTETPLLLRTGVVGMPTYDPVELLVDAAMRRALES